jgi:hypothetical protein
LLRHDCIKLRVGKLVDGSHGRCIRVLDVAHPVGSALRRAKIAADASAPRRDKNKHAYPVKFSLPRSTTRLQSELRCALPVTARLDKPPRAPTRGSRGAGAKPSRRSAEPRRAEGDMRDCLTVRRGFASAIGPRFIKRSTWLTRGRTVASQCMSVLHSTHERPIRNSRRHLTRASLEGS